MDRLLTITEDRTIRTITIFSSGLEDLHEPDAIARARQHIYRHDPPDSLALLDTHRLHYNRVAVRFVLW